MARVVRLQLRHTLDQDPTGINGLRAAVLIGQDEKSLAIWSHNVLQSEESKWDSSFFVCTQLNIFQMSYTHPLLDPIVIAGCF